MILAILGIIIGFVNGLTGAGGALIAIPLLMQFLGMSLKEASLYSLIAIVIASLSNFYYQRKNAHISLATLLVTSSGIGSYLTLPYKELISNQGIAILLTIIALYSLYSVWFPIRKNENKSDKKINNLVTVVIGLLLGTITTFTGLGGGVLMLPLLINIYSLPQTQAVATSLVVIGLSSLASFLIQALNVGINLHWDFTYLMIGILVTPYILKSLTSRLFPQTINNLRKILFTIVVGLALLKIF